MECVMKDIQTGIEEDLADLNHCIVEVIAIDECIQSIQFIILFDCKVQNFVTKMMQSLK